MENQHTEENPERHTPGLAGRTTRTTTTSGGNISEGTDRVNDSGNNTGTSANDRHDYRFDIIPESLKDLPQWGVWRREYTDGKPNNVPYDAKTGNHLSVNDPATWSPFAVALEAYQRGIRGQWDGLSVVLKEGGGVVGIDLDDCVDEGGDLTPEAREIVNLWGSYLEYSPSRRGLRGFAFGTLPAGRRKVGHLEIYDSAKVLTVTGWRLPDMPTTLNTHPDALRKIHQKFFSKPQKQPAKGIFNPDDYEPLSDDDVIDMATRAKNGARVQALIDGDFAGYASNSEADLAACNFLAFYCGPNSHEQIDRIFREHFTGFRPDKWEKRHFANGDSYGKRTVQVALEERREFYTRPRTKAASGAHDEKRDASGLPVIVTNNRPLREISDDSVAALVAKNDPPSLFVRSGRLTRRVHDEEHRPVLDTLTEAALCGSLTRSADFVTRKLMNDKTLKDTHVPPPLSVVRDVYSLGTLPFPPLAGLTECPVLRPDGTVVMEAGYDTATRLFYEPAPGLRVPRLPSMPTEADARTAAQFILAELLPDFPFCHGADLANMVGCFLTPIVRPAILGNIPLCLLDKPSPGSGASLLSDLVAIVAMGTHAGKVAAPEGRDGESEWRKRITALLIKGGSVVVIDNIDTDLGSSALSSVLTAGQWEDRLMGKSEMISVPMRACFIATANNISVRGDLARRCYRVRIDAKTEQPWTRTDFRHDDIMNWTRDHRGELLAALLTMARAWFVAQQPKAPVPKLGMFEQWTTTIGGILAFAGVPGFLDNLNELYALVDDEGPAWAAFLKALQIYFQDAWFTTAKIANAVGSEMYAAIPDAVGWDESKSASSRLRLGKAFQKRMDRIYAGLRLERNQEKDVIHNTAQWRVRRIGEKETRPEKPQEILPGVEKHSR